MFRIPRPMRPFLVTALMGSALIVSACAETATGVALGSGAYLAANPELLPIEDFSKVREERRPKADLVQYSHDVHFTRGAARLTKAERQRLDAFLARINVGYGDRVYVVPGRDRKGVPEDTARRFAERRLEAVTAFLALRRLKVQSLLTDFGVDTPARGGVNVIVRRYVVTLPGCPDWTGKPGITYDNLPSSNFGCATAVNLGLMVADPGDIAVGRRPGPMDGEFIARSIERYRKGETTPLDGESPSSAQTQQDTGGGSGSGSGSGSGAAPLD